MKAGILAAGHGARLRSNANPFKPLVEIAGRPLLARVLDSLGEAGVTEATVLLNEDSLAVRDHISRATWPFPVRWVIETTPSSMHTFLRLVETLATDGNDGPFLLSTVDTITDTQTYARFLKAALAQTAADVVLALTSPGDDEKPLLVRQSPNDSRVIALGPTAAPSDYATAGIYLVRASILREAEEARRDGIDALRIFLGRLLERGYHLVGIPITGAIDVDRPRDIETAEAFLRSQLGVAQVSNLRNQGKSKLETCATSAELDPLDEILEETFVKPLLGLYREEEYSPGRHASNDVLILNRIAACLRARGRAVELLTISAIDTSRPEDARVFSMLQGKAALEKLLDWEAHGAQLINRPQAALNTHRDRLPSLMREAGIAFPSTELIATTSHQHSLKTEDGLWLKRGDIHASISADVQRVDSEGALEASLAEFARRGIAQAVLQEHRAGDEIKFYGVGAGDFFHWFYSGAARKHPFAAEKLRRFAVAAAAAAGLDIFGGDVIVSPTGELTLIDLNDWPSFAPCREAAAHAIAEFILRRFHAD